jgi:diguanylate cyclase (GGDEF)-like protein/PAS domain S-box-containing protein
MVQKKNITQIGIMKEMQSRIEESESRYRMLFDQGADMILVNPVSESGERVAFTQVNDMACKTLGYSRDEFLKLGPEDILAPDSENSVDGILEKLLLDGKTLQEITLLAKNGKRIPAEINVHLVNLEDRSTALCVIRDITMRKVAERVLKASEHRYASLFNDNEAVMILIDPGTGIIRDANPAACSFYGYSREDLVGRRFSHLLTFGAENGFFDLLDSANKGRKKHFELENRSASGTVLNVELYATRVVFDSGPHILLMIHDISEKIKAQEKVRRLNEELLAISTTDKLTGIKNRRHMEEILDWEMDKSKRYGDPMSLIMFDLDGFKSVNDTYGHGRGDEVLIRIARECGLHLRSSDFFGRWGGDEFLLVTPVPQESALILAEKIRTMIRQLNLGVTASIGVASLRRGESRKSVLERVDSSMYLAKQQGGNRVLQFPEKSMFPGNEDL